MSADIVAQIDIRCRGFSLCGIVSNKEYCAAGKFMFCCVKITVISTKADAHVRSAIVQN